MEVKVLGPGCARCKNLYQEAEAAIRQSGVAATLVKVESMEEILRHDVLSTPGLVIDGVVRSTGRVPKAAEIAGWLIEKASGAK
jgi:small redox-active disulfide protein 2